MKGGAGKLFKAVIMGAPGSGKGTIGKRIVDHFPLTYLSCGDIVRQHMHERTPLGERAREFVRSGRLIPDQLTARMMRQPLEDLEQSSWLLDGFPRTLAQAHFLYCLDEPGLVVDLDVPHSVILERLTLRRIHPASGRTYHLHFQPPLKEGLDDVTGEELVTREDDRAEVVQARLRSYRHWNRPMEEYYRSMGILRQFSGTTSNAIWPHVFRAVAEHIEPTRHLTDYL